MLSASLAGPLPSRTSCSSRVGRILTIANSDATKNALASTSAMVVRSSNGWTMLQHRMNERARHADGRDILTRRDIALVCGAASADLRDGRVASDGRRLRRRELARAEQALRHRAVHLGVARLHP